jgi:general stress protein YciG
MTIRHFCLFTCIALLTACSTNQEKPQGNLGLPGWVLSPSIDNGLADTACVNWTGYMHVDRNEATAIARNRLVQQIELRAASMTKTHASKTNANGGANVGTNFENNARQIAEATLKGSKAVKTDIFDIDNKKQLCVMVTVEAREMDNIANQIIGQSGARLSNDDKAILREQFKAQQGQEELKEATAI